MKRKYKMLFGAIPVLGVACLIGGFKLQQVMVPFSGVDIRSDGSRTKYQYYLAVTPGHIRRKWGDGFFTRIPHGQATSFRPDGTLRGRWSYINGNRHGKVAIYQADGSLHATWKENHGVLVDGSAVAYSDKAEKDFTRQGIRYVRK